MVRYFNALIPVLVVGALVLLSLPWLGGMIALTVVLAVVAAIAWAIVYVPYRFGRAFSRRWRGRRGARPPTAAAQSPARPGRGRARSAQAHATAPLPEPSSERKDLS